MKICTLCTCTHFVTCANRSSGQEGNIQAEKGLLDFFALLMCSTFVWLTEQPIHGRGASVGQKTRTDPG